LVIDKNSPALDGIRLGKQSKVENFPAICPFGWKLLFLFLAKDCTATLGAAAMT
jgi:hypothetical protein